MESHLIDDALLGQLADVLIAQKFPDQPVEAHADAKKDIMIALDNQISRAILGSLTQEQGTELSQLLEKGSMDEQAFEDFFKKYNINLEEIIQKAMEDFKDEFLKGGQNA